MGKQILIIGAGKSATVLIQYLQKKAVENGWYIVLADADVNLAAQKWNNAPNGHSQSLDVSASDDRLACIEKADIVISMMPASLHFLIAKDCLTLGKSLFTASYVDDQMKSLASEIHDKKLLFLCEMGLDPGIDHMSAMELVDRIRAKNGKITSFKSHCGGLIAPECDTNPWHYKISWNPRNIILAGKAGAIFLEAGAKKTIDYLQIFENAQALTIPKIGTLAYYPNRDSLSYMATYHLQDLQNFVRTTLRHPDFCKSWNAIVQLGLTSESEFDSCPKTVQQWFEIHLATNHLQQQYQHYRQDKVVATAFDFLAFNSPTILPESLKNNASVLQWILEEKWKLEPSDKDLVVMMHEIAYEIGNQKHEIKSSLVVKGKDAYQTAMATTVGLPLAIAACAYLENEITLTGLHIPTLPQIYQPILKRLAAEGIQFEEQDY